MQSIPCPYCRSKSHVTLPYLNVWVAMPLADARDQRSQFPNTCCAHSQISLLETAFVAKTRLETSESESFRDKIRPKHKRHYSFSECQNQTLCIPSFSKLTRKHCRRKACWTYSTRCGIIHDRQLLLSAHTCQALNIGSLMGWLPTYSLDFIRLSHCNTRENQGPGNLSNRWRFTAYSSSLKLPSPDGPVYDA